MWLWQPVIKSATRNQSWRFHWQEGTLIEGGSAQASGFPLSYFSLLMYTCLSRPPPVVPCSSVARLERESWHPPSSNLLHLSPINRARLSGHSAVCGRWRSRGRRKWGRGVQRRTRASLAGWRVLLQNVCLWLLSGGRHCRPLSVHDVGGDWSLSVVTSVTGCIGTKPVTSDFYFTWPTRVRNCAQWAGNSSFLIPIGLLFCHIKL